MQGKTINGYTLQRQLGVGGMAEVWLADNAIGKKAAVKLLLPKFCNDEAIVARFENEAKVMVQLDHPNIRQVYDYANIDGRPCIVMEYLEGDDLKALMKSGKRFTEEELRKWWNQIADALNYTHAKGIVHRDIKPSNLFLDKKGNIKLLDFGIAKIKESISMTQTGAMMGTLLYMSPEQVEDSKHIGPQSDIYSLAVTFVHLLTGKAPYDITTSSDYAIRKGIVEIPLDLTAVPADWRGFLAPYLAKKPENRPTLKPFEAVACTLPASIPDDNDATISDNAGSGTTASTFKGTGGIKTTHPTSTDKPKSKKGLWIGLGFAVVVVVALLLLFRSKNDFEPDGTTSGHEWVDLGLPSGTLWATCNIGASKPQDYGDYYAWGETHTKSTYNWDTYKYVNGGYDKLTKYCNNSNFGNNGFTDNLITLQGSDDPAAAIWGSEWCTPSDEQWNELLVNTSGKWTRQNGVGGRLITASNGKSIFLPAAGERCDSELHAVGSYGRYWSRSLNTDGPDCAWCLCFYWGDCSMESGCYRRSGHSVRPVREK